MIVCVLSQEEQKAFVNHGHTPSCKAHRHIKSELAYREVVDQGAEWVGNGNRRITRLSPKIWVVKNFNLQLVDGVVQGRAGTFRYPVEAIGARNRRLPPGRTISDSLTHA